MILYVHFYRAGGHYYFGTPHMGQISSHKAGQGQDPSAVVYWALLSDMAQILMKKFSANWFGFHHQKLKQNLQDWHQGCNLLFLHYLILPGLGFLSEIVNLLIPFWRFESMYIWMFHESFQRHQGIFRMSTKVGNFFCRKPSAIDIKDLGKFPWRFFLRFFKLLRFFDVQDFC